MKAMTEIDAVTAGGLNEAASVAEAIAHVRAKVELARALPRDSDYVRAALLKDCRRPRFAEGAIYRKPAGNTTIEGPSVRLAEAAIRAMGNIDVAATVVHDDPHKRVVRVTVHDLETNNVFAVDSVIEKTIERRQTRKGDVVLGSRQNTSGQMVYQIQAREDLILMKVNAEASKALRNAALRILPRDILDEALDVARETMASRDAEDPDAARRRLIDSFGAMGIPVKQVAAYLGHEVASATAEELRQLRAIGLAVRDGEVTWAEVIGERAADAKALTSGEEPKPSEVSAKVARAQAKLARNKAAAEQAEADRRREEAEG